MCGSQRTKLETDLTFCISSPLHGDTIRADRRGTSIECHSLDPDRRCFSSECRPAHMSTFAERIAGKVMDDEHTNLQQRALGIQSKLHGRFPDTLCRVDWWRGTRTYTRDRVDWWRGIRTYTRDHAPVKSPIELGPSHTVESKLPEYIWPHGSLGHPM